MNNDLISRKAQIKMLDKLFPQYDGNILALYSRVREATYYAPAVDAVPVTHGRYHRKHIGNGWDDWDALTCSVCGKYYEKPNFPTNYCPNCGAMMNKGGGNAGV